MSVIRVGTRGSKLALVQTENVCTLLAAQDIKTEIVIIKTEGDAKTSVPLHEVGGQGLFVRALDDAIAQGTIDCAVHSMKDIPAERPDDVTTCAVLKRDSPADFLVHFCPLEDVRVIGTSSTRRRAQLRRSGQDFDIRDLRGNVDTRIRKLREGEYDAIVLAEAGMQRLGLELPGTRLREQWYVPSPNQGTVAVVCRTDPDLVATLAVLDHPQSRADTMAERAVMEEIKGGCFTPQGVFCEDGFLIAEVLALDGSRYERIEDQCPDETEGRIIGEKMHMIAGDLIPEAQETLGIKGNE
jgi:hydroxymethylbilane synthase